MKGCEWTGVQEHDRMDIGTHTFDDCLMTGSIEHARVVQQLRGREGGGGGGKSKFAFAFGGKISASKMPR